MSWKVCTPILPEPWLPGPVGSDVTTWRMKFICIYILQVVSTHLKRISQVGSFRQVGVKLKNIWNHHAVYYCNPRPAVSKQFWLQVFHVWVQHQLYGNKVFWQKVRALEILKDSSPRILVITNSMTVSTFVFLRVDTKFGHSADHNLRLDDFDLRLDDFEKNPFRFAELN